MNKILLTALFAGTMLVSNVFCANETPSLNQNGNDENNNSMNIEYDSDYSYDSDDSDYSYSANSYDYSDSYNYSDYSYSSESSSSYVPSDEESTTQKKSVSIKGKKANSKNQKVALKSPLQTVKIVDTDKSDKKIIDNVEAAFKKAIETQNASDDAHSVKSSLDSNEKISDMDMEVEPAPAPVASEIADANVVIDMPTDVNTSTESGASETSNPNVTTESEASETSNPNVTTESEASETSNPNVTTGSETTTIVDNSTISTVEIENPNVTTESAPQSVNDNTATTLSTLDINEVAQAANEVAPAVLEDTNEVDPAAGYNAVHQIGNFFTGIYNYFSGWFTK